jgi:hypothetical protein
MVLFNIYVPESTVFLITIGAVTISSRLGLV